MNELSSMSPERIVARALAELDIRIDHNVACLEETQHWLANTGLDDPSLEDLTKLPFVTIDNPDSRDLDQALLIERESDGYRVQYALADAAYYIRPGSALFAEALVRGTTFYTPTMAAAMLPVELSEGLISLNPDVDRRALIFDMRVNLAGIVGTTTVRRARIRSQAKLNYAGVQRWLDSSTNPQHAYDESLTLLRELGELLIDASTRRGVIRFDRTETRIQITGEPPHFEAAVRERYDTERYNEQISLLCNMQGAELLMHLGGVTDELQTVFRVHDAPLTKSMNALRETLTQFAEQQDHPDSWRWNAGDTLANYLATLPDDVASSSRVRAVQRQVMQAQRASTFRPDASEHHALKADSYARFSSPMREVVGIFTHKELLEALGGDGHDRLADEVLREAVITAANEARQKQRKLTKRIEFAALSSLFARELDSGDSNAYTGIIMGMRRDRLYISLDDTATDIKVYSHNLDEQFSTTYTMSTVAAHPADSTLPVWRLGQEVMVKLREYDPERKRFLFRITGS